MLKLESKAWVLPVFLISSFLILFVDHLTARGSADYIFYFVPVSLLVYHSNPLMPFYGSAFCTILAAIGFLVSPDSEVAIEVTRLNRLFAVTAMWVVSYQVKEIIKSRNEQIKLSWIRNSSNLLAERVRGDLTTLEVADNILTFLNERIDAKVSSFFVKEKANSLNFFTGHAYKITPDKMKISFGEGLLGQCAESRKLLAVNLAGAGDLKISSSLMEGQASNLTLVPLVADNQLVAVIELTQFRNATDYEIEFLHNMSEMSAIAIKSAQNKEKVNELLHQTQQFAEELQSQQEELKVSNEELEQQTKALKESHVRLENQAAEMEQTNQQLEEQAQALETQKKDLDEKNYLLEERAAELRKASQYKSEFLANMSHELRTPLNSTLILAKLLADNKPGNLNEEQVKYADIIYNSGTDLLNLINDILDLSKVEAGKMMVTPEVVNIEKMADVMKHLFKPQAQQKDLDYKVELDPKLPVDFVTDRMRIEQILKNFLANAFKFTHKGSVILQIFPSHDQIVFAVSDTGVGMSPDEQQVIFEAFRQADGTTSRKYGGTGLGLSISRELGHLLGGEIKVQSQKGQGSTFSLSVPQVFKAPERENVIVDPVRTVSPIPTPVIEKSPVSKGDTPKFTFEDDRKTIRNYSRSMLIIEDDEAFAKILYELAHEMNYGAIVTNTGEEGMDFAKEYQPNAIVLDIRLPDHSGMIVLDHLKMNTRTRHIPVHVISSEDFSRSALEMGAIGYMLKPVKRDELSVAFQNMNSLLEQKVKHVLVIEDDKVQRDHITGLIADQTVRVTSTETAHEALELLSKNTYDLMVMDLSLPDMSGYDLLKNVSQENSTYSFPPVIVYTARDLTTEEEEKLRLYAGSIIIKGAKSPERLLSEVTLFLHRVETELPPERQKMLKDLRSREKGLDGKTILVVDDDVRNIFALSSALEHYGAKIETARNGKEALSKLAARPSTNLVLMDIMMPEMDGYTAMREIRKQDHFKDLPIIALTAKAMKDDKAKCLEAGANDYLSKPLEIDKLLSLIRVWIPQKRKFTN